jgi:hypothetical protein
LIGGEVMQLHADNARTPEKAQGRSPDSRAATGRSWGRSGMTYAPPNGQWSSTRHRWNWRNVMCALERAGLLPPYPSRGYRNMPHAAQDVAGPARQERRRHGIGVVVASGLLDWGLSRVGAGRVARQDWARTGRETERRPDAGATIAPCWWPRAASFLSTDANASRDKDLGLPRAGCPSTCAPLLWMAAALSSTATCTCGVKPAPRP